MILSVPSRVLLIGRGSGAAGHRLPQPPRRGRQIRPRKIYAKAQKAIRSSSYGEAVKQLEALQSRFPFSEPARQAQLDLIYAYYKNRQVDPAIDAADTSFVRTPPTRGSTTPTT